MYIYLNGKYLKEEEANISPFDHGYLYGLGVFETIRTYKGSPFLLDEHLERLHAGLRELNIGIRFEYAEVLKSIEELSRLNDLQDSYIRFNVSAGVGEIGLQTEEYTAPTIIIFQKSLSNIEKMKEKEAVVLKLRRNTPETTARLKSHHFFNNVAAKRELGSDPNKEGILLSEAGFLAEGVTSNLFWIKEEVLYTPALETGILNGITRQFVLKLAQHLGLKVKEGLYQTASLEKADEIFFTNSIQEIVPVHRLGSRTYPGKNGDHVKKLYQLYERQVLKQANQ